MVIWRINRLYVEQVSGLADVVTSVNYSCYGGTPTGVGQVNGTVKFSAPGSPFVLYSNLTEQQVLNWVWGKVDRTAIEESVNIVTPTEPTLDVKPLPWS
jgi:hypothetical protein